MRSAPAISRIAAPARPRCVGTVSEMEGAEQMEEAGEEAGSEAASRAERLALGAAAVTVLFWSSAFIGVRDVGHQISPGALTLGRIGVGAIALGFFSLTRREPLPPRRDLGRIVLVGVVWFGIYNLALNAAEQRVDAGTAAMLVNVGPVLIALAAGTLLGEGFPRTLIVGCAVAFAGAVVIGAATRGQSADAGVGALLCLLAAVTYAIAVIAQKPLLERSSALQVTFLCCLAGTIACLPFAPRLVSDLGDASTSAFLWIIYLGVVPTAIGFTTWAYALGRTSAGKMGATTYLVPPIAILMGWVFLSEAPPGLAFAGGALCLAGVSLTRRRELPRFRRRPLEPADETPR
jgi:drug/metabolite transporter (DMT)-like permease